MPKRKNLFTLSFVLILLMGSFFSLFFIWIWQCNSTIWSKGWTRSGDLQFKFTLLEILFFEPRACFPFISPIVNHHQDSDNLPCFWLCLSLSLFCMSQSLYFSWKRKRRITNRSSFSLYVSLKFMLMTKIILPVVDGGDTSWHPSLPDHPTSPLTPKWPTNDHPHQL